MILDLPVYHRYNVVFRNVTVAVMMVDVTLYSFLLELQHENDAEDSQNDSQKDQLKSEAQYMLLGVDVVRKH